MKNKKKYYLSVLTLSFLLAACGGKDEAKETTVSVNAKGAVTETIVGSKTKAKYTAEELQTFVDEDIKKYNSKTKEQKIDLKSCEIANGIPRLQITYNSCGDYADYHNTRFFYGTINEAQSEGYDFNTEFVDNNGDTAASATILANDSNWHVVVFDEPVRVKLSGDIIYTSRNAKIINAKEAKPKGEKDSGSEDITTDSLIYLISTN